MASYLTEVIRPPKFYERSDESQIETLRNWIPNRWKNGQRDSVQSIGEILGEARDYHLYRKIGCEDWSEYCSTYLRAPWEAMDELIKGVRILQGQEPIHQKPISEEDARRAAREDAAAKAREQARTVKRGRPKKDTKENRVDNTNLSRGWCNEEHLLRRLARKYPDTLNAWERGEFATVADAARAVDIYRKDTPLTIIRRAWKKASAEEREQIIAWINEQAN